MSGDSKLQLQAWKALSKFLPSCNEDQDYWWKLTGRHVASLLEAAGYPLEKQFECLLFHYRWTVPYMGPAPGSNGLPTKWKSLLSLDGSAIEYSWKWNTKTSEPGVRYVTEPIGEFPGTELDPLNQQGLRELLQRFGSETSENLNIGWVNHFFAKLYDHDNSRYIQEAAAGSHMSTATSVQLGIEFLRQSTGFKTYFFPRKLGIVEGVPTSQYDDAIVQLDIEGKDYSARKSLNEFLTTNPEGKLLNPFSLAIDNVHPEKSRLKWYFHTPNTSFKSVREVMTLGGRITGIDRQLKDLFELIRATAGLPDDFPENAEVPLPEKSRVYDNSAKENFSELEKVLTGYLYYFDIAPGNKYPEIKWFIPTRHYGPNDLDLAKAIINWMEKHRRAGYGPKYLEMLCNLGEHRRLDEGKGLQTFVSCLFKKGELDITTYLGAEAFHPARKPRRSSRGTRRRGDD